MGMGVEKEVVGLGLGSVTCCGNTREPGFSGSWPEKDPVQRQPGLKPWVMAHVTLSAVSDERPGAWICDATMIKWCWNLRYTKSISGVAQSIAMSCDSPW